MKHERASPNSKAISSSGTTRGGEKAASDKFNPFVTVPCHSRLRRIDIHRRPMAAERQRKYVQLYGMRI